MTVAAVRVAQVFDRLAAGYDRQIGLSERVLLGDARSWVASQATGVVVEIGVGTGLNLPLYTPQVRKLVGVDISEQMLALAAARVSHGSPGRVELRRGDAEDLDLPDEFADTVVSTYTLCSIPDPQAAVAQVWRVLRPGGVFVLAEHGPARSRLGTAVLRLADPIAVRLAADHLVRDPVPYLRGAGFTLDTVRRTGRAGMVFRIVAHKPEPAA